MHDYQCIVYNVLHEVNFNYRVQCIICCLLLLLEIRNQSPRNNDFIECSEDFYLGEDGCRAECGRFEYWPHHIEDLYNILLIVALVIGAIICVMASNARHCELL